MTIKEVFENFNITQEEFAAFTGIPRHRIASWIKDNKDYPPKADDATAVSISVNFLSKFPKEQTKTLVKNYRYILGNIETLEAYETIVNSGIVAEPAGEYEKMPPRNNKNHLDLPETNNNEMINRILNIIEHSNANMETMSRAFDKIADANLKLSNTVENLSRENHDGLKKAKAS